MARKKIAVFFGERSFEHDISILTGLQAIKVIDQTKFETFPIYIDLERNWWTGEGLLNQSNYPLGKKLPKDIRRVRFVVGEGKGYIETVSKGIFRNNNREYFDAAFLAFHGDFGETGAFQGLMESSGIPYTGCRMLASTVFMNKVTTKQICRSLGIPVLPVMIVMSAIFKPSIWTMITMMIFFSWTGSVMTVRSMAMQLKEETYIEAARTIGAGHFRIIFNHLAPLLLPFSFASMALAVPSAIVYESSLSLLGLGDASIVTWGQILHDAMKGSAVLSGLWWWIIPPGILIAILGMSFAFLGFALDKILHPKLRSR